jgi:hypothetical protein
MRSVFVVLAVSLSITLWTTRSALADPLSDTCSKLIGGQVTQCLAAANGRYISSDAVNQCGHLIGTQVVACVSAIAGKEYGAGEAGACGKLIGTQVVDCFRSTGRPHVEHHEVKQLPPPPPPPPHTPSYAEVRAEIAAALEQMRDDPRGAEARLRRLLSSMR